MEIVEDDTAAVDDAAVEAEAGEAADKGDIAEDVDAADMEWDEEDESKVDECYDDL